MRGGFRAALVAGVLVATVGSQVGVALPVGAASRVGAPSQAGAATPPPAEPLIPKKMRFAQQQLTAGPATRTALPHLASSAPCNSAWNTVASPNPSSGRNIIAGLAANAPNDAWAVGFYVNNSSVYQTLAEHWDGSVWTVVTTPNVGPGNNLLTAVTAIGPSDVWAVGFWRPGGSNTYAQPLTQHWNGNGWTIVPTPNAPARAPRSIASPATRRTTSGRSA